MNGKELPSIQELTFNSIQECDIDVRRDLYQNIILSGGTTLYEGIGERLLKEIENRAPKSITLRLLHHPTEDSQSGEVVLPSPLSQPSPACGLPRKTTTSTAPPLFTESASERVTI